MASMMRSPFRASGMALLTLVTLYVAGCAAGDRPIAPKDEGTVSAAVAELTPPPGYERSSTCAVQDAKCFTSDAHGPLDNTSARSLVEAFGLHVDTDSVTCSSVSGPSLIADCAAYGRIG